MTQLRKVMPGDLITADQMNAVIDEINSLNERVGAAAQTDQLVITDLVPPSGTVQVGRPLEVLGRNFGFTAGALRVYVDDLLVTLLTSATDERIVFTVPLTLEVPPAGRAATLTISNGRSSAQRTLTLLPAIVLSGSVDVVPLGTTPTTPVAGSPFTLRFRLRSRASVDTTFAIDPQVAVGSRQNEWEANLRVLDGGEADIPSRLIPLGANRETTFSVRVSPIPAGTTGTPFSITVGASSGSVIGSSGAQDFTVGELAEQPDETITLNFALAEIHPPTGGSVTPTRISLRQGADVKLGLTATFTIAATYNISARLLGATTNWEFARVESTTPAQLPITSAELQNPQGMARKTLEFGVRPVAGASAAGTIEFTVTRAGQTRSRKYPMTLQLLP